MAEVTKDGSCFMPPCAHACGSTWTSNTYQRSCMTCHRSSDRNVRKNCVPAECKNTLYLEQHASRAQKIAPRSLNDVPFIAHVSMQYASAYRA